jgi:5-(carboxyamino)imidazole ribonucleotide mutase
MDIKKVAILMGSDGDLSAAKRVSNVLQNFGIISEMRIMSAYRTPTTTSKYSEIAADDGFGVIIVVSGGAAHLAGVVATHTTLPVIALPLKTGALNELGALLSIVQMPVGVPIAAVGVDCAENAAFLAVQILALYNDGLKQKLIDEKKKMEEKVLENDLELNLAEINNCEESED